MRKLGHLESWLSQKKTTFSKPKIALEQYATDPHLAACLALTAAQDLDEGSVVIDLGCGSGMLSMAMAAVDCLVISIDIDVDAVSDAQVECKDLFVDFILGDACQGMSFLRPMVSDCAISNPPFGTKHNAGIDYVFVQSALKIAPICFSMHKTACREVLKKKISMFAKCEAIAQLSFNLPKQYKFHKESSVSIQVDLIKSVVK